MHANTLRKATSVALGIAMGAVALFGAFAPGAAPTVAAYNDPLNTGARVVVNHEDPADCETNGLNSTLSAVPAGTLTHGTVITYSVTYSNVGATSCNITGLDADLELPDGTIIPLLEDAVLNVGDTISCPGDAECVTAGPYTYVVAHADETGPITGCPPIETGAPGSPIVTAFIQAAGVLHSVETEDVATDCKTISRQVAHPDVRVNKTATTPVVTGGNSGTFNIVVTNDGPGTAENVTLTDNVRPGTTVGGPNAADCSIAANVLTCDFGDLADDATRTITLTVPTTLIDCATTITNTATINADFDTNPANNTSTATFDVVCSDVQVVKTSTTPVVTGGNNGTFNIVVTNNGPNTATNVTLTDNVRAGTTVGGPDAAACNIAANVLTCNFGTLTNGATRTITLTVPTTLDDCGDTITNTATVSADVDTDPTNNTSSASFRVECPDVQVVKTSTTPVVDGGANGSFTIVVTNNGPGTATNVTLTDNVRAGTTVGGPDAADCSIAANVLTCDFGDLANGATRTITLTVPTTLEDCGDTITNTATVNADVDTNPANNTSTASFRVECVGDEGCTPGYWKNHPGSWTPTGYSPNQTLESVFDVPDSLGLDNVTLIQALDFGGGSGVQGGARILLRAAVAALLNAAHPSIEYPRTTADVIADVNAALASGNRGTMLTLAGELDTDNNLGCSIDAHGNPIS